MKESMKKADCRTRFSPVTPDAIRSSLVENDAPADHGPRIAQLLDELQLKALTEETLVPDGLREQADGSRYLYVDEYTGEDDLEHSHLLFVTGGTVRSYFEKFLPDDVSDFEQEIIELACRVYANKSGFDNLFQPPIVPLVLRLGDHDAVVMAEPGPYQPLPNGTSQLSSSAQKHD